MGGAEREGVGAAAMLRSRSGPRLVRLAYRMLGSMADAEDVVQEAFIRWMAADRASVDQPEAYLRRTVARLSLDVLKSARRRRETYVGPWLPEPVIEASDAFGADDEADDVTLPLACCWPWSGCRRWNARPSCCTTCSGSPSRRSLTP